MKTYEYKGQRLKGKSKDTIMRRLKIPYWRINERKLIKKVDE